MDCPATSPRHVTVDRVVNSRVRDVTLRQAGQTAEFGQMRSGRWREAALHRQFPHNQPAGGRLLRKLHVTGPQLIRVYRGAAGKKEQEPQQPVHGLAILIV